MKKYAEILIVAQMEKSREVKTIDGYQTEKFHSLFYLYEI